MSSTSKFIEDLKNAKLSGQCPHCENGFDLAKTILFDGTKKFPLEAEMARKELLNEMDVKNEEIAQRLNELKRFQMSVDKTSEERAVSTGIGKILEKVLPYYKDFKLPLSDCRFLAEPLDVIVFEGASKNDVKNIIFMDIKTGNASLQKNQRQIRDLVVEKKVKSELIK